MSDVLTRMLGFKWREESFPISSMSISLEQGLVPHRFFNRDGADVEATGREALLFSATIPFRNGVAAGLSEEFRVLYPDGWKSFLRAMSDKTVGYLTHPELGQFQCRPQRCTTSWDPNKRDGCDVEATWMETTEFDDGLQTALNAPQAAAEYSAVRLDDAVAKDPSRFPKSPVYKPDLTDTLRAIGGIGDQVSLASGRVTGKLDQVLYRVKRIEEGFTKNSDPRNFTALQAISRLKTAVREMGTKLGVGNRTLAYYMTRKPSTLAGLADAIPAKIGDLMRLNTKLLRSPVVPAGTLVRYL